MCVSLSSSRWANEERKAINFFSWGDGGGKNFDISGMDLKPSILAMNSCRSFNFIYVLHRFSTKVLFYGSS